jgi:uncharacterized membrane protein
LTQGRRGNRGRFPAPSLARIAVLAAVYVVLTVVPPLNAISYGSVQIRVSEAMTVLPFIAPWAPWGLYLGCIAANLGSPFLVWDITVGALTTLLAGLMTRRMPGAFLAPLPPVILNALVVSGYVSRLSGLPYISVAFYVGIGELVACYGLGYPLLSYIRRNAKLLDLIRGE